MTGIKQAIAMDDGVKGLTVIGKLLKVFETKEHDGENGPWHSQSVSVCDTTDNNTKCYIQMTKSTLEKGSEGKVLQFENCKIDSYEKEGKNIKTIRCAGNVGIYEEKKEGTPANTSAPNKPITDMTKDDWAKKQAIDIRSMIASYVWEHGIASGKIAPESFRTFFDITVNAVWNRKDETKPENAKTEDGEDIPF